MAWDPTSGGEHLRGSWRGFMQGSVCAQQAETEWLFLTAFLVCFFFMVVVCFLVLVFV